MTYISLRNNCQPWNFDKSVILRAPVQLWSRADGVVDDQMPCGLYYADVRILSRMQICIDGVPLSPISYDVIDSDRSSVLYFGLIQSDELEEPGLVVTETRTVHGNSFEDSFLIRTNCRVTQACELSVQCELDMSSMQEIRGNKPRHAGRDEQWTCVINDDAVHVTYQEFSFTFRTDGAVVERTDNGFAISWSAQVAADRSCNHKWSLHVDSVPSEVMPSHNSANWVENVPHVDDEALRLWMRRSLHDLDAMRMSTAECPGDDFIAAGAPWYFTLFGRDSLWAARFLLPVTLDIARGTLRTLSFYQSHMLDVRANAEPGKIIHELRTPSLLDRGDGAYSLQLPSQYYGTIDATPLWIILLFSAWRQGLSDADVESLIPTLNEALSWMMRYGDADGDGFLEYVDRSGRGLVNQGWKDSKDAVRWQDGRRAEGPIALCEVQGYAYQAAMEGVALLESFGESGTDEIRNWADRLKQSFNECFWVDGPNGAYPAMALDRDKRPVDALSSNIGHLLGTGILDAAGAKLVKKQVMSDRLLGAYGVRTLSTDNGGYWPLSYHCGSIWAHDTAITMLGLNAEGYHEDARELGRRLIAAAKAFDYQIPELYAGETFGGVPIPYPESCHPQGWSAATAVAVYSVMADEADF